VHISAKADYAVRALAELAVSAGATSTKVLADSQHLPVSFLENIMMQLRRAEVVTSQRGNDGGYRLARSAATITVADVIRAVEGPLAEVRGLRPEATHYEGAAAPLGHVWIAVRASLRNVLEHVTIDDIATGRLPSAVTDLADDPDAWRAH
jgi:Rrf2 family protein